MSAAIERRVKRQKLDHGGEKVRNGEVSSIQNSIQLEEALRFRQDIAPLKEGLTPSPRPFDRARLIDGAVQD